MPVVEHLPIVVVGPVIAYTLTVRNNASAVAKANHGTNNTPFSLLFKASKTIRVSSPLATDKVLISDRIGTLGGSTDPRFIVDGGGPLNRNSTPSRISSWYSLGHLQKNRADPRSQSNQDPCICRMGQHLRCYD
jgi:hypothetical protein